MKVLGIVHIQFIYYIICIRAIGFTQQTDKLEFVGELGVDSLRRGRVSRPFA